MYRSNSNRYRRQERQLQCFLSNLKVTTCALPDSWICIPEILSDISCSIWVQHHRARVEHLHCCYKKPLTTLGTWIQHIIIQLVRYLSFMVGIHGPFILCDTKACKECVFIILDRIFVLTDEYNYNCSMIICIYVPWREFAIVSLKNYGGINYVLQSTGTDGTRWVIQVVHC